MVHAVPDILARIVGRKRNELAEALPLRAELERKARIARIIGISKRH
jgi:hypothetical protein